MIHRGYLLFSVKDRNLFHDTSLSLEIDNPDICGMQLQPDIDKSTEWAQKWIVKFNSLKSESLVITRKLHKPTHPDLFMSNTNTCCSKS